MLAAYLLGKAEKYLEQYSDGTQRRQIALQNFILRIAIEGGFRCITLNSAILSEDETSEFIMESMLRTFKEGWDRLTTWQAIVQREYP